MFTHLRCTATDFYDSSSCHSACCTAFCLTATCCTSNACVVCNDHTHSGCCEQCHYHVFIGNVSAFGNGQQSGRQNTTAACCRRRNNSAHTSIGLRNSQCFCHGIPKDFATDISVFLYCTHHFVCVTASQTTCGTFIGVQTFLYRFTHNL